MVGLQFLDIPHGPNHRLKTTAENITEEGFDLLFDTWSDTRVYGCGASWIAIGERAAPSDLERTIQTVKDELLVPGLGVVVDAAQLAEQESQGGTVDFLTALERALRSLIEDPADGSDYTAATAVKESWDGVPPDVDAQGLQQIIRGHLNGQTLTLMPDGGESGASVKDYWIFRLKEGMGDMHWILVDRHGAKPTVQEIT